MTEPHPPEQHDKGREGRRRSAAPADGGPPPPPAGGTPPPAGGTPPPAGGNGGSPPSGGSGNGSGGGGTGGSTWQLHGARPLSPLIDENATTQVFNQVFEIRNTLAVPSDATAEDAKEATAVYMKANEKRFNATEEAMGNYQDVLPKTLAMMPLLDFQTRRKLAAGMFVVADGMIVVQGGVRLNGMLRTDELCDVADAALQEARTAAAAPGAANNARLQALVELLSAAAQEAIDKQQQGKQQAQKQAELNAAATGDLQNQLASALSQVNELKQQVSQLQQEKTLGGTGAPGATPPAAKGSTHHTHKTLPTPAPGGATPSAPNTRSLPRK